MDDELRTHLQIFHDHNDEDYEEFSHRYDNARLEFEYPFHRKIDVYLGWIDDLAFCGPVNSI